MTFDFSKLKSFYERHKIVVNAVVFVIVLTIFFYFGMMFSYAVNGSGKNGLVFDGDHRRVRYNLIDEYSHYRTSTHPLFPLVTIPFVWFIRIFIPNPLIATIFFMALVSTANLFLFVSILKKIVGGKYKNYIIAICAIFYAFSFSFIQGFMIIETFVFNAFSILLFWNYYLKIYERKTLGFFEHVILVLIGALMLSLNTMVIIHFVFGVACLLLMRRQSFKQLAKNIGIGVILVLSVMLINIVLAVIQQNIFPTSINWFTYLIEIAKKILFKKPTYIEEFDFINTRLYPYSWESVFFIVFGFAYFPGIFRVFEGLISFEIAYTSFWGYLFLAMFISLFIFSIVIAIKNKRTKIILPLLLSYISFYVFYMFYGVGTSMLYQLITSFVPILIIAVGLSSVKNKKLFWSIFGCFLLILGMVIVGNIVKHIEFNRILRGIIWVQKTANPNVIFLKNMIKICLILTVFGIAIWQIASPTWLGDGARMKRDAIYSRNNHGRRIFYNTMALLFCTISVYSVLLNQTLDANFPPEYYKEKVQQSDQLFVFGMGQREKYYLTNDGDIYWQASDFCIIKGLSDVEIDRENYKVSAIYEGKEFLMYENEMGIYYSIDGVVTTLDDSQTINIPTFEGNSQQKALRILFGEVMTNIGKNGPMTNIFTGEVSFDAAVRIALVCEETNNLAQIRPWIQNITPDVVRNNVKSTETYGQILYLQSLLVTPNQEVVDTVVEEAKKLKNEEGSLAGENSYYDTSWIKFGLACLSEVDEFVLPADQSGRQWCWWSESGDIGDETLYIEQLYNLSEGVNPWKNAAILHFGRVTLEENLEISSAIIIRYNGILQMTTSDSVFAAELFLWLAEVDTY